jgi:hypothetical protein
MRALNFENASEISYNKDFIKVIIARFDLISSILLIITSLALLYFTPFLGYLIRKITVELGYGRGKFFLFFSG